MEYPKEQGQVNQHRITTQETDCTQIQNYMMPTSLSNIFHAIKISRLKFLCFLSLSPFVLTVFFYLTGATGADTFGTKQLRLLPESFATQQDFQAQSGPDFDSYQISSL